MKRSSPRQVQSCSCSACATASAIPCSFTRRRCGNSNGTQSRNADGLGRPCASGIRFLSVHRRCQRGWTRQLAMPFLDPTTQWIISSFPQSPRMRSTTSSPVTVLRLLEKRLPVEPTPRPAVTRGSAYELRSTDPIFETFRRDYPGFDDWLAKCKREHRPSWVVVQASGDYTAVCIVKHEVPAEYRLLAQWSACSRRLGLSRRHSRAAEGNSCS